VHNVSSKAVSKVPLQFRYSGVKSQTAYQNAVN